MTVTLDNSEAESEGASKNGTECEQVTPFVPSRDLPTLAKRSGGSVSPAGISASLHRIASSLGVAKGQSEHILVDVRHPSQKATKAYPTCEEVEEVADQFETQFTHRWLLNVNCLGWLEDDCDADDNSIDSILSESSRLVAVLSGQSASGGIRKIYHFPRADSKIQGDPISVTIKEAAIVEDSLGGRTWSAAPLLADHLLKLIKDDPLNQLNVLELGAGTGLTGLTMAKMLQILGRAGSMHLTDFNENVLSNLKINARLNGLGDKAEGGSLHAKVFPLDWSEALTNSMLENNKDLLSAYDCLLCADCIYEPQHAALIHAVANRLLTKEYAIRKRSSLSRPSLPGKMFVLTPLRANLQKETETLYRFFPRANMDDLDQEKAIQQKLALLLSLELIS
ncbi:uncharacterized protein FA14DRAFT_172269 [Meira miltonrushii]|uniref:S-adenosyl-L-methionine-dependent methyltransferase n=1 Tax=Meira miltonrushii TaxID=1280837 RepID=A0A316VF19_9BASI|nr:uncharacterized protein FA14DRAFT_172269 [Meira miltonrushii]PWN35658.1 hypothetical protein FA14DRAFT_172269 [Meira miltonrushii]